MKPKDALSEYRAKRSFDNTPEPQGADDSARPQARFVIQEHHARRLHWDLRLEREGVLASWALPRGVPAHPDENRLAVRTEDHPLAYIDFHGEIPKGQYGAGTMTIWDSGTYEAEKWEDRKVIVRLDGEKTKGRYALFATRGKNWMIHRMDPPPEGWTPLPEVMEPMRSTPATTLPEDESEWGFEVRWEGARALAFCEPGHLTLRVGGADAAQVFPEVRSVLEAIEGRPALLDGVVVAFDESGHPSAERLERRAAAKSDSTIRRLRSEAPVAYVAFDLLHLDGSSLMGEGYVERRKALEALGLEAEAYQAPAYHVGDGAGLLRAAAGLGLDGVIAKRLDSEYVAGEETRDWLEIRG